MNEIDGIKVDPDVQKADDAITFSSSLKIALTNWNFWWLAIFAFTVYGPMMGFQGLWAVPYMMQVLDMTKQEASNVISFWAIGMIFGCPISGIISDRIMKSRKKVIIIGSAVYTLLWLYIAMNPTGWTATSLSVFCFLGGAFGGWYITNYPHVSEHLPLKVVGVAIGVFNMWYFVGGAFYQQFMGKILDGYAKVQQVVDGVAKYAADGSPIMVYPVEAFAGTFWLCFFGMVVGTIACFFTRETYGKAYGKVS
jgi:sugar phosphate permease